MKRLVLAVVLLTTAMGWGQGYCHKDNVFRMTTGGFLAVSTGARVRVCLYNDTATPCTAVATFSNPDLKSAIDNPVLTDGKGQYSYCVAQPGNYKEQILSGSSVSDYQPVLIGVPAATTNGKGAIQLAGDLGGTPEAPTVPALAAKADLNTVNAHTSAAQAHGADGAVVGSNTLATALAPKANDSAVVHKSGDETVGGNKHFTGNQTVDGTVSASSVAATTTNPGSWGPNTCFPHFVDSGAGTNASPWTHSDGTAGIQTCVNQLASTGGTIFLAPGAFYVTSPISIRNGSITVQGVGPGFSAGQYAFSLSTSGTRIIQGGAGGNVFRIGSLSGEPAGGISLKGFYVYGAAGRTLPASAADYPGAAAVVFDGNNDQPYVEDLRITNFPVGVVLAVSGMHSDSTIFHHMNMIGNGLPFYKPSDGNQYFGKITFSAISDNDWWGAYLLGNAQENGIAMIGNTWSRNCRIAACAASSYPAQVVIGIQSSKLVSETYYDAGVIPYGVSGNTTAADLVYNVSDTWVLAGWVTFSSNTYRRSYQANTAPCSVIQAHGINLEIQSWTGCQTDVLIKEGITDTIIADPKVTLTDRSGIRTVMNGISKNSGDPEVSGDWAGHAKWPNLVIHNTVDDVLLQYTDGVGNKKQINPDSFAGTIKAVGMQASGPNPSISGCGVSSVGSGSVNGGGYFVAQTTGTCSVTLTLGGGATYPHAYNCAVSNQTRGSSGSNPISQSANTSNSVSFSGTTVTGDVIVYGPCAGW
jgi:hypothetical protein